MSEHVVAFDDVTLQVTSHGPSDGALAVLLHGFPDTALTFRHLAPHLADLGYRVIVPSMRGYAPSSIASSQDYSVAALATDANRLHEYFGGDERAILVGHDWGSAAVYPALASDSQRWSRGVAMSVPPLAAMMSAFMSFDQLQRSWYMFFFQHPLSDMVVPLDNFAFISRLWQSWSPGYESDLDVSAVVGALAGDVHLTAALSYYRAALAGPSADTVITARVAQTMAFASSVPPQPILYLHGENDGCISSASTDLVETMLAPGSRRVVISTAGHFLHLERPTEVHREIDLFLAEA